ncbi:MAG: hypothetical protein PHV55_05475 [Candidatus Omnitrophica bacterium]|nr:hypothetical protein [Candidatus Omnitrophota bacterium]
MKRIVVLVLGVAFMVSFGSYGFAAEKKKTTVKTTVTKARMSDAQEAAIATAAVEKLSSQEWIIYLTPSGAKKSQGDTDVLTFSGRTMSSRNLNGKGFSSSNFLPIVREDTSVMLEAVQRSGEDKLAMWRVELSGDVLQGVLTLRTVNGPVSTYTFTNNMPVLGQIPVSTTKKK